MIQTILGAGGAIGTALAAELRTYTNQIRLVSRNPVKVNDDDILIAADLTRKEKVFEAIKDSGIVYVTVGFPYDIKIWRQNWIPMIQSIIAACRQYGTKLVFFDNIYAIGKSQIHHITEESPISPSSKKGEIRAEINRLILKSMGEDGLQAIIARAPDFFGGTSYETSLLVNMIYEKLRKNKKPQWLCDADKIHSFGYVPDLARGTAILGNTIKAYNQIWHLPVSSEKTKGKEWIRLFAEEMHSPSDYSVVPSWMIRMAGLFNTMMREVAEMNYQYEQDYYFDSSKFNKTFDYQPVSNETAVKEAVAFLKNRTT